MKALTYSWRRTKIGIMSLWIIWRKIKKKKSTDKCMIPNIFVHFLSHLECYLRAIEWPPGLYLFFLWAVTSSQTQGEEVRKVIVRSYFSFFYLLFGSGYMITFRKTVGGIIIEELENEDKKIKDNSSSSYRQPVNSLPAVGKRLSKSNCRKTAIWYRETAKQRKKK